MSVFHLNTSLHPKWLLWVQFTGSTDRMQLSLIRRRYSSRHTAMREQSPAQAQAALPSGFGLLITNHSCPSPGRAQPAQ